MRVSVAMTFVLVVALAPDVLAQAPAPFKAGGIVLDAPPPPPSIPATQPSALPPAPRPGLQIAELHFTTQVAFGRPVDRVTTFKPDQPAIFAWFRYTGGQPGAPVIGRLVFLAPAGEIEATTLTGQVAKPEDVGYFKFNVPSDGWPEGRYRFDVIAAGAPVRSQEFRVGRPR